MKSTILTSALALVLGSFLVPASAVTSDQCLLSLVPLLADPGLNSCLPMQQFTTLMTAAITPELVNTTVTSYCSYPACSQDTLTLVENTVTQNCANGTDPNLADIVHGAASLYPSAKEGICQRVSPTNGTFCITVLVDSLTTYVAQNPSPLGSAIFSNETALEQYVANIPASLLCTSCTKSMINPLDNYIAQNQSSLKPIVVQWATIVQSAIQLKCGADFTNGAAPTASLNGETGSKGSNAGAASAKASLMTALLGTLFAGAMLL
ncbi:hypothetical protein BGZ98_004489 [Dissophora globulifera]|nr:hypothetical protein BGZ98_004489 [Dissophora globulifera]